MKNRVLFYNIAYEKSILKYKRASIIISVLVVFLCGLLVFVMGENNILRAKVSPSDFTEEGEDKNIFDKTFTGLHMRVYDSIRDVNAALIIGVEDPTPVNFDFNEVKVMPNGSYTINNLKVSSKFEKDKEILCYLNTEIIKHDKDVKFITAPKGLMIRCSDGYVLSVDNMFIDYEKDIRDFVNINISKDDKDSKIANIRITGNEDVEIDISGGFEMNSLI